MPESVKQTSLQAFPSGIPDARPDGVNGPVRHDVPIIAVDIPVIYEDEGQEEMGETEVHVTSDRILWTGLKAHLASQPDFRVCSNLNVYYHRVDHWAYVSPDTLVVRPVPGCPEHFTSYRIGEDGPAPVVVIEVLSRRSFQQQDLTNKPIIYAQLGIAEYILVDVTGTFLPQRLLLKRLQPDRTWIDEQDPDGGVSSQLGFRIVMDPDGQVRVVNGQTGKRYARPEEAEAEAQARHQAEKHAEAETTARHQAEEIARAETQARRRAEDRVRELEAELARLRGGTATELNS